MLCSHLPSLGGIFSLTQSNETSDSCTCSSAALAFQKIRDTQEGKLSLPRGFHVSHVSSTGHHLSQHEGLPEQPSASLYTTHTGPDKELWMLYKSIWKLNSPHTHLQPSRFTRMLLPAVSSTSMIFFFSKENFSPGSTRW